MMFVRFFLLFLADITANVIGYLFNPLFPLFAGPSGNLPEWLRWFQTHDATLDGAGADGATEPRFLAATAWLRNSGGQPRNAWCRYFCRVAWLYRNNAYGFSVAVLGAPGPFQAVGAMHELYPPLVATVAGNRSPAQGGWQFEVYRGADGKPYFHFWYVRDRGNGKCHEANIGWKISAGSAQAQLVCRYSPWRAFETPDPAA